MVFASRRPTLTRLTNDAEHLANWHQQFDATCLQGNQRKKRCRLWCLRSFDLGEFHQKGLSVPGMGLKKIIFKPFALKAQGNSTYGRVVLNHKVAADHMEAFQVIEVDPEGPYRSIKHLLSMAGLTLPSMVAKIPTMTSTGTGTTSQVQTTMPNAVSLVFTWSRGQ